MKHELNAWLLSEATARSYSRGEDYYGDVDELELKEDTFTGRVWGSHKYKVRITINDSGISSYCSCPYNWGGICKHIVAVGLNIANGEYIDVNEKSSEEVLYGGMKRKSERFEEDDELYEEDTDELDLEEEGEEHDDFMQVFYTSSETQKLLFLKDLLSESTFLQERFKEFLKEE